MTNKRTKYRRKDTLGTLGDRLAYIKKRYAKRPCPRCKQKMAEGKLLDGNCDICGYGHDATVTA